MSTGAIVSMLIILTVVVGGFLYFLTRAIKKERDING
ncbi:MetS family NSS transporter small subunit [Ekhidna sp.]